MLSHSDLQAILIVVDLLLTLPPTSVACETLFSQMNLVKTKHRSRLTTSCLNDLLIVKLESEPVSEFSPDKAVDKWLVITLLMV